MTNNNFDWLKLIDKIKDTTICVAILISAFIIILLNQYNIIQVKSSWHVILILLFLFTFCVLSVKLINILSIKFNNFRYDSKSKINRLNDIFYEVDTTKRTYKYSNKRALIIIIYNNGLKTFSTKEVLGIINGRIELYYLQEILNDLCNKTGYSDNSIIKLDGGKYKFYSCIWKELEKYEKNGIISNSNK